jgi:hypothetical protein
MIMCSVGMHDHVLLARTYCSLAILGCELTFGLETQSVQVIMQRSHTVLEITVPFRSLGTESWR